MGYPEVAEQMDAGTVSAMAAEGEHAAPPTAPLVWLVLGDKLGDNAQVEVIARALGWPTISKRLTMKGHFVIGKPSFRPSLYHVDLERSDPLTPPWPDLVLTVGRRPSMAALWIRRQSGNRTKIVLIGRPRRMIEEFALVLATPQYRLPARVNVMHLDLPLMRIDEAAIDAAAVQWRARIEKLTRPVTAVLVGGPTKPFVFNREVADLLITKLLEVTAGAGTLFVSTSRRTPPAVVDALAAALPTGAILYRWQPDASDNPYRALLRLADRFAVTGDSISMMIEVARLGRPLAIFPLPEASSCGSRLRRWLSRHFQPPAGEPTEPGLLTSLGNLAYHLGFVAYARDLSALHQRLVDRGAAVFLGQPFPSILPRSSVDEVPAIVSRVRALLEA